jgi:hypothetical protein
VTEAWYQRLNTRGVTITIEPIHADEPKVKRKRKRKRKAPSGRRSYASDTQRKACGRQNIAVVNAMFDNLPAATKAHFASLDAAARQAEAGGNSQPFGPPPYVLSRERCREAVQRRGDQLRVAIMDALATGRSLDPWAVIPDSLRPTKPVNVCGEFGDGMDALKAYRSASRSLVSQFNAELNATVRKLLSDYNAKPALNDNARETVARAFGVDPSDASFTVLPPLNPRSVNVRWHGSGTRELAKRVCELDLQHSTAAALHRSANSMWAATHEVINVAELPKLSKVPRVESRSWQYGFDVESRDGVAVDMIRHAWEAVVKRRFPKGSKLRSDLAACEIVVAFVGTRGDVSDLAAGAGLGPDAHTANADAPTTDFLFHLINRHCLSPWEANFMQLSSAEDPRSNHFISIDVYSGQRDAYELFQELAFGGQGDGLRIQWSTVFFRLMKRDFAVAQTLPDLHGAMRLFDEGDASGVFSFWLGPPGDDDVADFKRRSAADKP